MVLVVDCGNTDTVFGLYANKDFKRTWRIPSSEEINAQDWSYRIMSELLEAGCQPANVRQTVLSSVVPVLTPILMAALETLVGKPPIKVGPSIFPMLNVKVHNPTEIGADLVANAVAAYNQFKMPCVVVDFGTALTFTTILADGQLAGVAIAPGLKTAVKSLLHHTAQLPEVPLEMPESALGKNTIGAIQAGVVMGYEGMIRHLLEKIKEEVGESTKVIATGGLSEVIKNDPVMFDLIDRQLTLRGLALIEKMVKK